MTFPIAILLILMAVLAVAALVTRAHGWGRFEARTRLPKIPATIKQEQWLAALPMRAVKFEHRPREHDECACLAATVHEDIGDQQVWLSISVSSLAIWHRRGKRFELAHRSAFGPLQAVTVIEQAYGLFSRNHYAANVDNLPVRGGWRHRLRLVFTDHSSMEVIAPAWSNARLFAEVFSRLIEDVDLRILGALAGGQRPDSTGIAALKLQRRLRALVEEGFVQEGYWLTNTGRRELDLRIGYIATMARFVQTDAIQADFTGG